MNKKLILSLGMAIILGIVGIIVYPKIFSSKPERTILYWTDPMIPGDRSDRPGKSPMGMERTPVYADETSSTGPLNASRSYYTCPMHTFVHKDAPGVCPVCGMTLVRKTDSVEVSALENSQAGTVTISASKQVLANVSTTIARRESIQKDIISVGKVEYAEPNYRHISARFPGRVDKLYLTFTGENVNKGDPVADIYSPEAVSAQREYLLARDSYEQVKEAADIISTGAKALLDESKQKLLLWGFTQEQIADLESTKLVANTVTIHSPVGGTILKKNVDPQQYVAAGENIYDVADLSTVWMSIDVYEYELPWLKTGQRVEATMDAYPAKVFAGEITFISPTLEPSARTVRVRAEFPNPSRQLKLDMFVNAVIKVHLSPAVVVPRSAVLSTGQRYVVWVRKSANTFEPRFVMPGASDSENIQVLQGLSEGEVVVSAGGYLIDSESQLQGSK